MELLIFPYAPDPRLRERHDRIHLHAEFYLTFTEFKKAFKLENYSNYTIDKFLWTYGRKMIFEIVKEKRINLRSAKSKLRKSIKIYC